MTAALKTIAILVANPALSSILQMVLASSRHLRVREFESELGLFTYMRIAPVNLIVLDFDNAAARADLVTRTLRCDLQRRSFQVIALAGTLNADTANLAKAAGIDEVIAKPMSPRYLLERVLDRVSKAPVAEPPVAARIDYSNVVPLFGRRVPQGI